MDAAVEDARILGLGDLVQEPDAARAEDAALPVQYQVPAEFEFLLPLFLGLLKLTPEKPIFLEIVLELALARLVTDRTIQGVLGQQELENAFPGFDDLRAHGLDFEAFLDHGGAGQFQLGQPLDFDQTHPAASLGWEGGMVAEMGDGNAGVFSRP